MEQSEKERQKEYERDAERLRCCDCKEKDLIIAKLKKLIRDQNSI